MSVASGAAELLTDAVRAGAEAVLGALSDPSVDRGREDWLALAAACQTLVNTVTAVQDVAVAEVARREGAWCEDGKLAEVVHASGRVTLDAADLVAPSLGATHAQAQRRVEQAVRLADGLDPVEADSTHVPEASGLRGLHLAMAGGRLDGYRAAVVAHELDHRAGSRRRGSFQIRPPNATHAADRLPRRSRGDRDEDRRTRRGRRGGP